VSGRHLLASFRPEAPDEEALDLRSKLSTEMHKDCRMFEPGYRVNPIWTRLTLGKGMDDFALMQALCRKDAAKPR
jgi:hypothetical protein